MVQLVIFIRKILRPVKRLSFFSFVLITFRRFLRIIMWVLLEGATLAKYITVFTGVASNITGYEGSEFSINVPNVQQEFTFPFIQINIWHKLKSGNIFPYDFYFGVESTKNAWQVDDRTTSSYRNLDLPATHSPLESPFKYKEDIYLADSIGATMMKVALSWKRILPDGYINNKNEEKIQYYRDVFTEMVKRGIEPMVILTDGELPSRLESFGGWSDPRVIKAFEEYAKLVFAAFGDKVKYWATINEPGHMCVLKYEDVMVPYINKMAPSHYLCVHYALLAHAKAYRIYHSEFRATQKGKVGIYLSYEWFEVRSTQFELEKEVSEMAHVFHNDWQTHPIFGKGGDYPEGMKKELARRSAQQGYATSRLPRFAEHEILEVKGSADFLGVCFDTVSYVQRLENATIDSFQFESDIGIERLSPKSDWRGEGQVKNTPWALRELLERLNEDYDLPEIFVAGTNYDDDGSIEDGGRVMYLHQHFWTVLKSLQNDVNIAGYVASPLTDYVKTDTRDRNSIGLFAVDTKDANLLRTPKYSSKVFADVSKTKIIHSLVTLFDEKFAQAAKLRWGSDF